MNLYDSIFKRRSVRKYAGHPLSSEQLAHVKRLAEDPHPLFPKIPLKVHVVEDGERIHRISSGLIGSYGKLTAPHFLIATSEPQTGYLENTGFALEEMVLALTELGIGTCWIGGQVKKELLGDIIAIPEGHIPSIVIAFGPPKDPKFAPIESPKRKGIQDLVSGMPEGDWRTIFEAVRRAPSAINLQPWRFHFEGNWIHAYITKRGLLLPKRMDLTQRIDAGIALCHLKVAAEHCGKEITFQQVPEAKREDLIYITSAKF